MLDFFVLTPQKTGDRLPLDRKTILTHAFAILNEAGLEGLTLRRLAAGLRVQAPAIYWHFKNKQELLDEMATQVFREAVNEAPRLDESQSWQDWASMYCIGLRRTLLRYREGAKIYSGTYLTDPALYAPMEASLRKLTNSGFTLRQATISLGALYSFVIGFVIEEQAVHPLPGEFNPQYELAHRNARVDKEKYPLAHASGAEIFEGHDARFLEGIRLIVAGMASTLEAPPAEV
jgi:TetR/AcrR family transcriptional regulator, tetracycline repressor protein